MFLKIGFTQFVNIGYQTYFRNDFFLIVEAFVKSTIRNNMLEEGNYKKKDLYFVFYWYVSLSWNHF